MYIAMTLNHLCRTEADAQKSHIQISRDDHDHNVADDTDDAKREALIYNGDASIRVAVASQFIVKLWLFCCIWPHDDNSHYGCSCRSSRNLIPHFD